MIMSELVVELEVFHNNEHPFTIHHIDYEMFFFISKT